MHRNIGVCCRVPQWHPSLLRCRLSRPCPPARPRQAAWQRPSASSSRLCLAKATSAEFCRGRPHELLKSFVATLPPRKALLRVYARENATQRGNSGTAQVGSVAAAIRYVAKSILGGVSGEFPGHSTTIVRGQMASDKGIGHDPTTEDPGSSAGGSAHRNRAPK